MPNRRQIFAGLATLAGLLPFAFRARNASAAPPQAALPPQEPPAKPTVRRAARAFRYGDDIMIEIGTTTRVRPLRDFPALAAASDLDSYDIREDGIFWPEIGFLLTPPMLAADGWKDLIISWNRTKFNMVQAYWILKQPRSLAYGDGKTTVVEEDRNFVIRRGDDVMVRPIGSYPAIASAHDEDLVTYEITPQGLRFPDLADGIVVPFPAAKPDGFVWRS